MGEVVSLLDRPVYTYTESDRLLSVSPGTTRRWVNGYTRAGVDYPPVVREEPTDARWVTWGEFVEARLLSEFRQGIPMLKLRPVVEWLREFTGRRYPLSYAHPFLVEDGRDLLLRAQTESGLTDQGLWMVFPIAGQGALMTTAARRFASVIHSGSDDPGRPIDAITADAATPRVLLSAQARQGQPTIRNIPTSRIAEAVAAGDPMDFVADTFGFSLDEVEQAVTYEATRRGA